MKKRQKVQHSHCGTRFKVCKHPFKVGNNALISNPKNCFSWLSFSLVSPPNMLRWWVYEDAAPRTDHKIALKKMF